MCIGEIFLFSHRLRGEKGQDTLEKMLTTVREMDINVSHSSFHHNDVYQR